MRRLNAHLGLTAFAIVLAAFQFMQGIHTDEAKYLLDIPYPHPPLGRFFVHLLEPLPFQEIAARALLALLLVNGVWLVAHMARPLPRSSALVACAAWLTSAALLLQAGSAMLVVPTAFFALLFLWIDTLEDDARTTWAAWIAIAWWVALFTAYQSALLLPVVLHALWRTRLPAWLRLACIGVPPLLLLVYSLSNPFTVANMISHAGKDAADAAGVRVAGLLWIVAVGGSVLWSVLGTIGLVRTRSWAALLSLLLVAGYVFLGRYDYYALLFTPFFAFGVVALGATRRPLPVSLAPLGVCAAAAIFLSVPVPTPSAARATAALLPESGFFLIAGTFGHEWQYESRLEIRRYVAELLPRASAIACLGPCDPPPEDAWKRLPEAPVVLWVRR